MADYAVIDSRRLTLTPTSNIIVAAVLTGCASTPATVDGSTPNKAGSDPTP